MRPALFTSRSTGGRSAASRSIDSRVDRSSCTVRTSRAPPGGAVGGGCSSERTPHRQQLERAVASSSRDRPADPAVGAGHQRGLSL